MNSPTVTDTQHTENMVKIVYILYLISVVFCITGIIGVIIAYSSQGNVPERLRSHFEFQINTFWIGAMYLLVGITLSFFLNEPLRLLLWIVLPLYWAVWLIVRCIKGISGLAQGQTHPNPDGWMF